MSETKFKVGDRVFCTMYWWKNADLISEVIRQPYEVVHYLEAKTVRYSCVTWIYCIGSNVDRTLNLMSNERFLVQVGTDENPDRGILQRLSHAFLKWLKNS